MSNMRIGYRNYGDLATLTGNPVFPASGPVTYLQNDARDDICLAAASGSQQIKGTWGGTAYPIDLIVLYRHNMAYNDTVQIELFSDAAWTTSIYDVTSPAYDTGLFDNWGWGYSKRYIPTLTCKSFRITVVTATAFECCRLFVGGYIEAPYNPKYGVVLSPETNSKQSRSESGSLATVVKADWRLLTFDMYVKTEADRAAWYEISRYTSLTKSFFIDVFPDFTASTEERDHCLMGKWDGKPPAAKLSGLDLYDFSMKVTEI